MQSADTITAPMITPPAPARMVSEAKSLGPGAFAALLVPLTPPEPAPSEGMPPPPAPSSVEPLGARKGGNHPSGELGEMRASRSTKDKASDPASNTTPTTLDGAILTQPPVIVTAMPNDASNPTVAETAPRATFVPDPTSQPVALMLPAPPPQRATPAANAGPEPVPTKQASRREPQPAAPTQAPNPEVTVTPLPPSPANPPDINSMQAVPERLDTMPVVSDQIAPVLVRVLRDPAGLPHLVIQLHPDTLGVVRIAIERPPDGSIHIRIEAERSDTMALLRRDAPELHLALDRAGVGDDRLSMSFHAVQLGPADPPTMTGNPGFQGFPEGRPRQHYAPTTPDSDRLDTIHAPVSPIGPVRLTRSGIDITA